jgi:pyrroline-5-carboxylate reductase
MTKIGFIGTGSMGGMFIRKFTETGAVAACDIIASNRSADKLAALAAKTGAIAAGSNRDVVKSADVIFLCVKPLDVTGVMHEIQDLLTREKLLVSIASSITIDDLSLMSNARVARVIPSVTSECLKGISLVTFGSKAEITDKKLIIALLDHISKAVEVEEKDLETLLDLTSCAPAFIAALMREFAQSAVRLRGITPELAELLVKETLAGTSDMLAREGCSFEEIVTEVATKGGITEEGVKIIDREAPPMYDHLLEATAAKRRLVSERIKNQK